MATAEQHHCSNEKIVVLGGGTGQFHILRGLIKLNDPTLITAISGTWDSGGSSGRLGEMPGVLPPGDARRCVIAVCEDEDQVNVLLHLSGNRLSDEYGPLNGHDPLNLIISHLGLIQGGPDRGIDAFCKMLRVQAKITPISLTRLCLIAHCESGIEIQGEGNLDDRWKRSDFRADDPISYIVFNAGAVPNLQALEAIKDADRIVFAPGSFYGSILPHLLVDQVIETIAKSRGILVFMPNVVTEKGQSDSMIHVSDYVAEFINYLQDKHRLDYILASNTTFDTEVVEAYGKAGQHLITVDEEKCLEVAPNAKIIKAPLAEYYRKTNLIRHEPAVSAEAILGLKESRLIESRQRRVGILGKLKNLFSRLV